MGDIDSHSSCIDFLITPFSGIFPIFLIKKKTLHIPIGLLLKEKYSWQISKSILDTVDRTSVSLVSFFCYKKWVEIEPAENRFSL